MENSTEAVERPNAKKITRAFVLTDGRLVDSAALRRAERPIVSTKVETSQELNSDKTSLKDSRFVEPPYDLVHLAALYRRSVPHMRAIRAKANDSVGNGFTIVSESGNARETDRQAVQARLKALAAPQSFRTLLVNAVIDLETTGNCYLEIVRSKGKIVRMNHIPSTTIRVTTGMDAYKHSRGNKKTFFKPYQEKRSLDMETGEFTESVAPTRQANELARIIKYDPNSDYYGIPDVIPALGALMGDLSARDYNLDFFENGAVPAYAVIIEGADMDEGVQRAIEDFFKYDLKGNGNNHRTVVIPVPAELGANVKVRFEPLNVNIKDGSFKIYRAENRDEILSAHGVPPHRAMIVKTGALGGDATKDMDRIYKSSEVRPLQEDFESLINLIITDFGYPDLKIKFDNDRFDDRGVLSGFLPATKDTLTVNEKREILSPLFEGGLDSLEGGDTLYIDVAGHPTPLEEVADLEPRPLPDPNGFGIRPTPPPPPNPNEPPEDDEDGEKSIVRNRIDYDDVDLDNVEMMNREYNNVKSSIVLDALREQKPAVESGTEGLIKVYDQLLREVYAVLGSQNKKAWQIWRKKSAPVRMNPVLIAVESFRDDFKQALVDMYSKAMKSGANFSGKRLNANVKIDGKAIIQLPDVSIQVAFNLKTPSVVRYIEEESDAMSDNITKTMSNRIRRQMEKGVLAGESVEQIKERLEENVGVPGLRDSAGHLITAEVRAAMIARTEVAKAFNVGGIEGYKSTGVVDDVDVIDGEDFDDACQSANGQTWSFRKADANPLEHPNCTRLFVPNVKEELV